MTQIAFRPAFMAHRGFVPLADWWHRVDRVSLFLVMLLCAFGIVFSFAASMALAERHELWVWTYVLKQTVFALAAISAMIVLSMAGPVLVRRVGVALFVIFAIALGLLPVFGTDYGKGAVRWFSLGIGSLQPSEFLKAGFAVFAAWLISGSVLDRRFPGLAISAAFTMFVTGCLVLQPDFGQAGVILMIWTSLFFVSGGALWGLALVGGLAASAAGLAYTLSDHVARRIDGYLSQEVEVNSQLFYAQEAIIRGGLIGTGPTSGRIKDTLPDAHTDFIIAVIAEEYGFLMVAMICLLYLLVILRSLYRLSRSQNVFLLLAGVGIITQFSVQIMINLGVATRLLPAKGITLPFLSYGGSSTLSAGIAMGLLLAATRDMVESEERPQ